MEKPDCSHSNSPHRGEGCVDVLEMDRRPSGRDLRFNKHSTRSETGISVYTQGATLRDGVNSLSPAQRAQAPEEGTGAPVQRRGTF